MDLGFTGTRLGITRMQSKTLEQILWELRPNLGKVHHGDCIGGDKDFHLLVRKLFPEIWIKIHPPIENKFRAFCVGDEVAPEKDFRSRNFDIVLESNTLIACPKGFEEELRSGTWMTIRMAKGLGRLIFIILPNGDLKEDF